MLEAVRAVSQRAGWVRWSDAPARARCLLSAVWHSAVNCDAARAVARPRTELASDVPSPNLLVTRFSMTLATVTLASITSA